MILEALLGIGDAPRLARMAKTTRRVKWIHWTIGEVAKATGRHPQTVRRDARSGMFDKRNLESVSRYVIGKPEHDLAEARRLYLALGVALDVDKQAPAWKPGDSWQTFGGTHPKASVTTDTGVVHPRTHAPAPKKPKGYFIPRIEEEKLGAKGIP